MRKLIQGVAARGLVAGMRTSLAMVVAMACWHEVFAEIPSAYKIVALPPLAGQMSTLPSDINNQNIVVGVSSFTAGIWGEPTAVSWQDGVPTALALPPLSYVNAINNVGDLGGNYSTDVGRHAFVQTAAGFQDIHTGAVAAYADDSYVDALNDAGQAAGVAGFGYSMAFTWQDGKTILLGTLGGQQSAAFAINNLGQVGGFAESSNFNSRAFLWSDANHNGASDPGEMRELPDLGLSSAVYGLNDHGAAVGFALDANRNYQAAYWNEAGALTLLGTLPGKLQSQALAINNHDQIVGQSDYTAFISSNGQMADLNQLITQNTGWFLQQALAINDNGWIVGNGFIGGVQQGFLLIPVPEPGTCALVISAALFLAYPLRKRLRRRYAWASIPQ